MSDVELPGDDQDFIKEKTIEGWSPEMIGHELRSQGSMIRDETVQDYLDQDSVQRELELERRIQEKKAEVSREDLIRELKDQIEAIRQQRERLKGSEDEVSNDATRNLLKAVRDLADMIDVLESKDEGVDADNVVHVNKLQQNFDVTQTVEYLPREKKKELVERLRDDPDVEDFAVATSGEH